MIAEKGKPRRIYSDKGINFVRAEQELQECLDRMEQGKISNILSQDGIQSFFNPLVLPILGESGRDLPNQQRKFRRSP